MRKIIYILLILFNGALLYAQSNDSLFHHKRIEFKNQDSIFVDSIPLSTTSLQFFDTLGNPLSPALFKLSDDHSSIIRLASTPNTILVIYQYFAPEFFKPYRNKSPELLRTANNAFINPFAYQPGFNKNKDIIDKDGLDMRGSISRGLGFGNSQNLVVNSNLNLQINGKLNNDIDISAAVSDDNNPIQPEGNTQQLQDFDRVYIKLSKNQTTVTLGDFEMLKPTDNYFMKYNKKSRGIQFSSIYTEGKNWKLATTGEGAISRGRFARNIVQVIEGNQGPYRLSGANNEQFIILIAGTEVIYLDGEKLIRGDQNDYTIDYNTGELTFMPKRFITKYSRVIAEFQYADRNYARSVFTFSQMAIYQNKIKIRGNYFSEQDHKNQPFQRVLSDTDQYILFQAGDDLSKAVIPTASPIYTFDKTQLLYIKRDTMVQGNPYHIYIFAAEQTNDTEYFNVTFNNVGAGNGNYIIARSSANGRVFQWVAPVNGKPTGNYEPVIQLISPKRLQMGTVGVDWTISPIVNATIDLVGTNYNKNQFSDLDHANDNGWGFKGLINKEFSKSTKPPKTDWAGQINYEQVDQNFRYIERYRSVEFDRIWNRSLQNTDRKDTGYAEKIANIYATLKHGELWKINQQVSYYNRLNIFEGIQNKSDATILYKKSTISGMYERLSSHALQGTPTTNDVAHYKLGWIQKIPFAVIATSHEEEKVDNAISNIDTLIAGSYRYTNTVASITNQDTGKLIYGIDYTLRTDYLPYLNQYIQASKGKNIGAKIDYTKESGKRIYINATYREFTADSSKFDLKPENTLLLRFEADWSFYKRLVTLNTYYQSGTGQELRRQFSYVEVQPGNGIYQWNDYNNDGIQQLNEFEIAVFRDKARYIKIFQPTTDYIQSHALQVNQTFTINPATAGVKNKFLRKWFWVSTVKIDRKLFSGNNKNIYNPFYKQLDDTSLVSMNSFTRSSLFYNRSNTKWGADFNYIDNRSKQMLVNGLDGRTKIEYSGNLRWNLSSDFSLVMNYTKGNKNYLSQYFTNRNFWYDYIIVNPKFSYQYKNNLRISLYYNYFQALNKPDYGTETTFNNEGGLEVKYSFKENGSLNAKVSFNKIKYSGDTNSPIAFDMLNGLQNGNNALWNLTFQQRISKNIQMNISYDGRKNDAAKTIHIARVEARYIF